jgi:hypothetical protein
LKKITLLTHILIFIMSLPLKIIGLIFLSALTIFSCTKKDEIGLQLSQIGEIGVFYVDTFTLNTEAVLKNDSIFTYNQPYLYTGSYVDPEFGTVTGEAFTQLLLKQENVGVVGTFPTVDSVSLYLGVDYFYGDTSETQTINVFKLTGSLDNTIKYNSLSPAIAPDPTAIDTDITFKVDLKSNKRIKIPLTTAFGQDVLDNMIGPLGTTNATLLTKLPGIALIPDALELGAFLSFKIFDLSTGIVIHYHNSSDTLKHEFELITSPSAARFSRITSDRSTKPVLSGLINSGDESDAGGKVYLESGIGIRTKIKFPTLNNFKNSLGNVALNRAELVLEYEPSKAVPYTPISLVQLLKLDSSDSIKQYLDVDGKYKDVVVQKDGASVTGSFSPLIIGYNSAAHSYNFNITSYIQAILYGMDENNGLVIATHPDINSISVNRIISGTGASKVKLRLYYTKID